jgi:hypothetical protein
MVAPSSSRDFYAIGFAIDAHTVKDILKIRIGN